MEQLRREEERRHAEREQVYTLTVILCELTYYCMKTDSMVPQKCVTYESRILHLPFNSLFLFMAASSSVLLSHTDFTCLLKLPQWRISLLFFVFFRISDSNTQNSDILYPMKQLRYSMLCY